MKPAVKPAVKSVNFLSSVAIVLLTLFLTACFNQKEPPADAPANVSVTEGDGLVVVDWDVVPGLTYWIFYKAGTNADLENYDAILVNITPPYVLAGLSNATQYAFAVTSSHNGSKAGPFSPAITATPRLLSPSIPWTIGTSLSVNDLQSIAFGNIAGNNTYVTVGDAATVFAASYDYPSVGGITAWNPATTLPGGLTDNLKSVSYDGLRFVALGDAGAVIKSTDDQALVWEAATAITGAPAMNALASGASRYVAVGDGGAIYTNTSAGVTAAWTASTSGTTNNLYGVSYLNNRFIAVGEFGTLLTSTDGTSWTVQTAVTGDSLRGVAYGASTYVAVGDAGAVISSPDATTWTAQSIPTTESFRAICFGPDAQFVAVGTTGVLAYSSTGADGSWATSNAGSIELKSISPNQLYIATGAAGANVSGK